MELSSRLLALNAGSSSLKAELYVREGAGWRADLRLVVDGIGRERAALKVAGKAGAAIERRIDHRAAAELVLGEVQRASASRGRWIATAHRIVHGGSKFGSPQVVTADTLQSLASLTSLAPLHNPPALDVLDATRGGLGDVPAVAVFDTAFFRSLPAVAKTYAVPRGWRSDRGIERFGFHGLAHEYLSRRCSAIGANRARRVVTLQLGSGCSAAALLDGRPVDTSMGFTPLEGLVMGTRGGDLDAGILLHLARSGMPWQQLEAALNRESGLLGLSEQSEDMGEVIALAERGEARAALAIDVFCYRVRKYIGAYAAALGGLDAIAFGGGIGESSAAVRSRICSGFEWLGVRLDERANAAVSDRERVVSDQSSAVAVHTIPVREERLVAWHACEYLGVPSVGLEP